MLVILSPLMIGAALIINNNHSCLLLGLAQVCDPCNIDDQSSPDLRNNHSHLRLGLSMAGLLDSVEANGAAGPCGKPQLCF